MASLINFSGIASGIDSSALIEAILDQQRASRINPLQTRIDDLTSTNSALSELGSLVNELKEIANGFRQVNGGIVAKLGSSSDETVTTASASSAASSGTYSVSVSQLAQNATTSIYKAAGNYTSTGEVLDASNSGTISVTVGSSLETVNVSVTAGSTTITDFVNSFNSQSDYAEASIVNVGTSSVPNYKIVISSLNTGTEQGAISINMGAIANASKDDTSSPATDAQFSIAGVGTVTRSSNQVSDVIAGVTLNLRGSGNSTVSITGDAETSSQAVQEFVEKYNEIIAFIAENDLVVRENDGEDASNIFGPLASTRLDDNLISAVRQAFSSSTTSGGSVNTFADLGIATQRDGTLTFDIDAFVEALADDPDSVEAITQSFGERLAAVDGTLAQYIRFNGLFDQATNANSELISSLSAQIEDVEKSLSKQEDALIQRFSRLEALMGELNSQQSALSSLIG